jgi:hypothetical protein
MCNVLHIPNILADSGLADKMFTIVNIPNECVASPAISVDINRNWKLGAFAGYLDKARRHFRWIGIESPPRYFPPLKVQSPPSQSAQSA